jgi:hypothetical protein
MPLPPRPPRPCLVLDSCRVLRRNTRNIFATYSQNTRKPLHVEFYAICTTPRMPVNISSAFRQHSERITATEEKITGRGRTKSFAKQPKKKKQIAVRMEGLSRSTAAMLPKQSYDSQFKDSRMTSATDDVDIDIVVGYRYRYRYRHYSLTLTLTVRRYAQLRFGIRDLF